jgi:diaminohydroxyphosphoribosylaminopyrimidine deaminase/5-amino-6-(5-phosphoribosylamino)uracil reductase
VSRWPDDLRPATEAVRRCVEQRGRPFVRLKAAATLDGKIATRNGESQWITGPDARSLGRHLRGLADGVMVGIGTALLDNPRLTAREEGLPEPARIVLDSLARLPPTAHVLAHDGVRRIVIVSDRAPADRTRDLRREGAEVLVMPGSRPQPRDFLPALAKLGLHALLVEGGGQVHASLIAQGGADELWLFMAGRIMGDSAAPGWCADLPGAEHLRLAALPRLSLRPPWLLDGGDILLRGSFDRPDSP